MANGKPLRVFLSAGEASGDLHAACLVRALRERVGDVEIVGVGGDLMEAEGVRLLDNVTGRAAMWGKALGQIGYFRGLLGRCRKTFRQWRPDVAVVIDFGGFHLYLSNAARDCGIPVLWYIPPQLWASRPWRVRKLRRGVRHVACVFPFEMDFYRRYGVPATFVGHPLLDILRDRERKQGGWSRDGLPEGRPLIGLLPGSRIQEIEHLLPTMLQVVRAIRDRHPNAGFAIAAAKADQLELIRQLESVAGLDVPILLDRTYDLMAAADLCLCTTGTTTAELLLHGTPMIAMYQVGRFGRDVLVPMFKQVPYIAMPNILAGRQIIPEFLLAPGEAARVIPETLNLLASPDRLAAVRAALADTKATLGECGAPDRVAALALELAAYASATFVGP